MKFCPLCGRYSVEYDPRKKAERCLADDCTCIIIDSNSYSYLEVNTSEKKAARVKVEKGTKTIIKQYSIE